MNDEWQVIFKNSYHVLKLVVEQNTWRVKQLILSGQQAQAGEEKNSDRHPLIELAGPTEEKRRFLGTTRIFKS